MTPNSIFVICILLLSISGLSLAGRADDCVEVGYARSAGGSFHRAYDEVKPSVVEKWRQEDEAKQPLYSYFSESLKNVTRSAYLLEQVSQEVLNTIKKTRVGKRCQKEWLLRGVEKHVTPLANLDQELADDLKLLMSFRCAVGSPYPNVDGTCISAESPDLGAVGAKFLRLLPAKSGPDGFSLRTSKADDESSPLPSARTVANALRQGLVKPQVTPLFTEWSHFLQQDVFSIPESPYTEGVDCCKTPDADDCAPIEVPEGDPLRKTQSCINFRRSARAQAILGHRESFSLVSTYIDATPLYGATNENAFNLKTNFFGYLKGPEKCEDCKQCQSDSLKDCFAVGEEGFTVDDGLHSLLILEHNRIADALLELNPHFDDALLYNEARRIVIAKYVAITYGNYLPILMGSETVEKHFLTPGTDSPAARYIKEVNPGVLVSYATVGFRNPSMYTEWSKDSGISRDEIFSSTHYQSVEDSDYQDILALDVQRARDQGLPSYVEWRRFCEPGVVLESWDDLKKIFSDEVVSSLKGVYGEHIDDVDAMVALLEPPMEGAVVGKTLNCIMADQFARLRTGNRLFWEYEGSQFTQEQIDELLKTDLASIMCANMPLDTLPTNPLLPVSDKNPSVKCSDVRPFDLQFWKDTSLIEKMKEINELKKGEQTPTKKEEGETEETKEQEVEPEAQTQTSQQNSAEAPADAPKEQSREAGAPEVLPVQPTSDSVVVVVSDVIITTTSVSTVTVTLVKEEL